MYLPFEHCARCQCGAKCSALGRCEIVAQLSWQIPAAAVPTRTVIVDPKPVQASDVTQVSHKDYPRLPTPLFERAGTLYRIIGGVLDWEGVKYDCHEDGTMTPTVTNDDAEVQSDHDRLVRELDRLLNGSNAARQASLCDIVAQVRNERIRSKQWKA